MHQEKKKKNSSCAQMDKQDKGTLECQSCTKLGCGNLLTQKIS